MALASRSLFTDTLDFAEATATGDLDGMTSGALAGPDDQSLRVLGRTVDFDGGHRYEVLVAGDAGEVADQIAAFRWSVALTLAALGIGLVIATTAQIRWGLRPLDNVRRGLAALRSGKETRFEGPFPAEIAPLAKELNALLESNQEIIERARTQVGNLAHALKTPLSVITNEARGRQRAARREGGRAGRTDADAGQPLPRAGADRGALQGDRRGHRGRAGGRQHRAGDGRASMRTAASTSAPRWRPGRCSAARSRTSRRSSATSSTTPANGRGPRCW